MKKTHAHDPVGSQSPLQNPAQKLNREWTPMNANSTVGGARASGCHRFDQMMLPGGSPHEMPPAISAEVELNREIVEPRNTQNTRKNKRLLNGSGQATHPEGGKARWSESASLRPFE
jgi:hypothetical protein